MTKAAEQKLTAQQFRVLNFRNIDDSGWNSAGDGDLLCRS